MKKYSFLIIIVLISGLVFAGCSLLSNVGQVPATDQSGITYLTKNTGPVLAARWDFDTITGGTVADLSDNGNTGIVYRATLVDSQSEFGKALSFDETNDYVEVGDVSELRFGNGDSITIEAWVQPAAATALGVIVQKGGITDHNTNYVLRQAGKKIDFFYRGIDNLWHGFRTNADVLTSLAWAHVAVTYTFGTPASIKIYVNGISYPVSGQWPGSSDPMQNNQTLRFGGLNYWGQKYYGLLDEVRIWSSALQASQLDDMIAPTISSLNEGETYLLNQVVAANGEATDIGTGVASVNTSVTHLDTSTVGTHTFTVTATDYAMNEDTKTVTYYVNYVFNNFLRPVSLGKPFRLGSTIPIKFQLTDAQGAFITDASPSISLQLLSNNTPYGDVIPGDSSGEANDDKFFRYDPDSNQYIFNLATIVLTAPATYRVTVDLGDGTSQKVDIGLK